ncbi:hypothetical protein AAHH80_35840, partial [Burkholderia pseudomallei]
IQAANVPGKNPPDNTDSLIELSTSVSSSDYQAQLELNAIGVTLDVPSLRMDCIVGCVPQTEPAERSLLIVHDQLFARVLMVV